MPKNQFQRPQQVARNHAVPRHGAPIPARKLEAKAAAKQALPTALPLPILEALLGKRH